MQNNNYSFLMIRFYGLLNSDIDEYYKLVIDNIKQQLVLHVNYLNMNYKIIKFDKYEDYLHERVKIHIEFMDEIICKEEYYNGNITYKFYDFYKFFSGIEHNFTNKKWSKTNGIQFVQKNNEINIYPWMCNKHKDKTNDEFDDIFYKNLKINLEKMKDIMLLLFICDKIEKTNDYKNDYIDLKDLHKEICYLNGNNDSSKSKKILYDMNRNDFIKIMNDFLVNDKKNIKEGKIYGYKINLNFENEKEKTLNFYGQIINDYDYCDLKYNN